MGKNNRYMRPIIQAQRYQIMLRIGFEKRLGVKSRSQFNPECLETRLLVSSLGCELGRNALYSASR